MKHLFLLCISALILSSCEEQKMTWQLAKTITVEGVNPIGIAYLDDGMWLSDGDHNRVVNIDDNGKILFSIDSLDRPMHIAGDNNKLLIPQYGNDKILDWGEASSSDLIIEDSLDAPAGVWKYKDEIGIADFYNNRILYTKDSKTWTSFGVEGKHEGEFYYPTDIQITKDKIYVADAYNNRIQVFNKDFKFEKIIGADQKMNATTGIYVTDDKVFATDFENDRILIFDLDGNLIQEITDNIEKPTDLILNKDQLFVINYRNSQINIFEYKEEL